MNKTFWKRLIFSILGVIINALGVAFITTSALGTVPATSIPHVFGLCFTPTIGQFTFVLSVIQVVVQLCILRKDSDIWVLVQLLPAVLLSYFIDFFMEMLKNLPTDLYVYQIGWLLVGCIVLGFAIALEVYEDLIYLPLDGMNSAIAQASGKSFEFIKIVVDCAMVVIAIISSFAISGKLQGVREGTVIAAVLVGFIVIFFNKIYFDKKKNPSL